MPPPAKQNRTNGGGPNKKPRRPTEKPEKKKLDLVCVPKYTNTLPDIPKDLKFLKYPFNPMRFIQYNQTSLERSYKFELHPDIDLGVNVDLINLEKYAVDSDAQMDPADEILLEDEVIETPEPSNRSRHNAKNVPWLRRTEYISTERTRFQPGTIERVEAKVGFSIKKDFKEEILYMNKESAMNAIEKTFEDNKKPIIQHPNKPNVYAVESYDIFPDFKNWKHPCAQVIFDSDPTPNTRPGPEKEEKMSQAMVRGVVDQNGDQYVAYFLPTDETILKRREDDDENRPYDEDYEYKYKMAREYNWNVKSKSSNDYEENYFLDIRPEGAFYNELETRVRLCKRRTKIGEQSSSIDTTLVVRHVPVNEKEIGIHKLREMQLQPYNGEEEDEAEEVVKRVMIDEKEKAKEMVIKIDADSDIDDTKEAPKKIFKDNENEFDCNDNLKKASKKKGKVVKNGVYRNNDDLKKAPKKNVKDSENEFDCNDNLKKASKKKGKVVKNGVDRNNDDLKKVPKESGKIMKNEIDHDDDSKKASKKSGKIIKNGKDSNNDHSRKVSKEQGKVMKNEIDSDENSINDPNEHEKIINNDSDHDDNAKKASKKSGKVIKNRVDRDDDAKKAVKKCEKAIKNEADSDDDFSRIDSIISAMVLKHKSKSDGDDDAVEEHDSVTNVMKSNNNRRIIVHDSSQGSSGSDDTIKLEGADSDSVDYDNDDTSNGESD